MSKVVPLDRLNPEVLLHQLLERDDIASVAVVWMTDDGGYEVSWSNQSTERLAAKALLMSRVATEEMRDAE